MEAILEIFAQKLIGNLMFSAKIKDSRAHTRIVDLSLDVLSQYLQSSIACKAFSKIQVINQIAQSHINHFNILQDPRQVKQLGHFFKVLTGLWLTEDHIVNFHDYLNQLLPTLQQVFSLSTEQLK